MCNSDEIASECAAAFDAGECTEEIFLLCEYMTVKDPTPAIQHCKEYIDAVCERSVICGGETLEDCRSEYAPKVDCDTVIGTHLNYEECIPKIRNLGCMEVVPDECKILFLGS